MKYILRLLVIRLYSIVLKLFFSIYPVKNKRVLFISYDGSQVSCNPYYIYKYLIENDKSFDCYWALSDISKRRSVDIKKVIKKGSFLYYKYIFTSQFIIVNNRLSSFISFRRKQVLINTWHGGGAFKRTFGYPKGIVKWYYDKTTEMDSRRTSIFLSSSKKWTDVIARKSFHYTGKVVNSGYPRNDLFFHEDVFLRNKIKGSLSINDGDIVVMYAPTFRPYLTGSPSNTEFETLDLEMLKNVIQNKYNKKCIILYRGHHLMMHAFTTGDFIDVSNYPDMQELLLISNILISDYSSCMWDFSLTHRPCFIYAPDFQKYSEDPGFESDFKEWPFIIVNNNYGLKEAINNFNTKEYAEKSKKYLDLYESYESGNASNTVYKIMLSYYKGNK